MAFFALEPPADPWLQTGVLAAVVANANPYRKGPSARPADFMPTPISFAPDEPTPAQQEHAWNAFKAELSAMFPGAHPS
jgi:hypothetical protein